MENYVEQSFCVDTYKKYTKDAKDFDYTLFETLYDDADYIELLGDYRFKCYNEETKFLNITTKFAEPEFDITLNINNNHSKWDTIQVFKSNVFIKSRWCKFEVDDSIFDSKYKQIVRNVNNLIEKFDYIDITYNVNYIENDDVNVDIIYPQIDDNGNEFTIATIDIDIKLTLPNYKFIKQHLYINIVDELNDDNYISILRKTKQIKSNVFSLM